MDPGHQEVKTALDLGAVNKTVDVKSIHRLSILSSCTAASCKEQSQFRNTVDVEKKNVTRKYRRLN